MKFPSVFSCLVGILTLSQSGFAESQRTAAPNTPAKQEVQSFVDTQMKVPMCLYSRLLGGRARVIRRRAEGGIFWWTPELTPVPSIEE